MPPSADQTGAEAMSNAAAWHADDPASGLRLALDALEGKPAPQAEQFLHWALGQMRDAVILRGHRNWVMSASFNHDGSLVVTGSMDHRVKVWDATTGEQLASFDIGVPPRFRPNGPQFSANSALILITGVDGRVYVVPWQQAVLPPPLPASVETGVTRATLALDGDRLITGHTDGTVRITSLSQSYRPLVLVGDPTGDAISSVAISPDGRSAAAADRSGKILLWDLARPDRPMASPRHTTWVNELAFSPDGLRLASASDDKTARLFDVSDGHLVAELDAHTDRVNSVAFSIDGTRLVTASVDRTARVFDASSGQPLTVLSGATGELQNAVFSPNKRLVAMAGTDGTCRVCYAGNGRTLLELRHNGPIQAVEFAADGKSLVTAGLDRTARVWNVDLGKVFWDHHAQVNTVAFNHDYTKLVTSCEDGRCRVLDVDSGELVAVVAEHEGAANSASFSSDGAQLVIAGQDGTARVAEWQGPTKSITLPHALEVDAATFNTTGDRVVTSTRREVAVWDSRTGQRLITMGPSEAERAVNPFIAIVWVAISHDGRRAVTSHYDEKARLWDTATGAQVGVLEGTRGVVYTAAFSDDDKLVITSGGDGTARLYDAATLEQRHVLAAPSGQLRSAALSPSGELAAGGGADGSLTIWKVQTEQVLCVVKQHSDLVMSVAFGGERLLASASDDGTAKLFDIETCRSPEELLAAARHQVQPALGDQ